MGLLPADRDDSVRSNARRAAAVKRSNIIYPFIKYHIYLYCIL